MSTLLPTPEAPMMKKTSPLPTSKLTSDSTRFEPKDLLMLRKEITKRSREANQDPNPGTAWLTRNSRLARSGPVRPRCAAHPLKEAAALAEFPAPSVGLLAFRALGCS